MKHRIILFIVLAALSGCRRDERADYPPAVLDMLATDLPADGKFHILRRGNFEIKPSTVFCTKRPGYGLDEGAIRRALAQRGRSGKDVDAAQIHGKFGASSTAECRKTAKANQIFAHGTTDSNRGGKSYKMSLIVWQGDAVWVARIERPGGLRADSIAINVSVNDGPSLFVTQDSLRLRARREHSKTLDYLDLSRIFFKNRGGAAEVKKWCIDDIMIHSGGCGPYLRRTGWPGTVALNLNEASMPEYRNPL